MQPERKLETLCQKHGLRVDRHLEPVRMFGLRSVRLTVRDRRGREVITDWRLIGRQSDPDETFGELAAVLHRELDGRGASR